MIRQAALIGFFGLLVGCGSSGADPAGQSSPQGGAAGQPGSAGQAGLGGSGAQAGQGGAGQAGSAGAGQGGKGAVPPGLPPLSEEASAAMDGATHLVVVRTAEWGATPARLSVHERAGSGWQRALGPFDAVVGAKGLSWGRGLTQPPEGAARVKKEGDKTAPAGLFRLGTAMGYAPAPPQGVEVPYTQAISGMVCVDDAKSAVYNTIQSAPGSWASSEPMKRTDGFYELLMLVDHNRLLAQQGAVPGGGSCIFLHVWGGPGSSTAGCTALDRGQLESLLKTLPSLETTVLVQLPQEEYGLLADPWGLPADPEG